jgi:hypothetical protein
MESSISILVFGCAEVIASALAKVGVASSRALVLSWLGGVLSSMVLKTMTVHHGT